MHKEFLNPPVQTPLKAALNGQLEGIPLVKADSTTPDEPRRKDFVMASSLVELLGIHSQTAVSFRKQGESE